MSLITASSWRIPQNFGGRYFLISLCCFLSFRYSSFLFLFREFIVGNIVDEWVVSVDNIICRILFVGLELNDILQGKLVSPGKRFVITALL